jgi:hypothetical protein
MFLSSDAGVGGNQLRQQVGNLFGVWEFGLIAVYVRLYFPSHHFVV